MATISFKLIEKLVEEFGFSLAEAERQLGVSSSTVAKALSRERANIVSPICQGRPLAFDGGSGILTHKL